MKSGFAQTDALIWNSRLYLLAMGLIGAAILSGLIEPVFAMTRFVPLDPNEGWNAFFGQIAVRGGQLYPPPGTAVINNYPFIFLHRGSASISMHFSIL